VHKVAVVLSEKVELIFFELLLSQLLATTFLGEVKKFKWGTGASGKTAS
jgi:hypothetical protein